MYARLNLPWRAAAFALGIAASVYGQTPQPGDTSRWAGVPVQIGQMETLRVTPGRVAPGGQGGWSERGCQTLTTHTNASFTGDTYRAQAGMANGEAFAATYTIPAASFPIKIDLVETIFVTSGATQMTETEWTILFYSGTPTSGSLVASYSSNGLDLPHVQMPPGTNGLNLQFAVDPNSPEQVIIDNNGSNSFTVAMRIDQFHQPSGNPCQNGPPSCCNAYLCTDNTGLAAPSQNWLLGINCGAFGCPPNGGWSTYGNLNPLCRPTGDWVSRTTWSPVLCTPGVGACCINGVCEIRTEQSCASSGGTYQGDGTPCSGVNCPQQAQACCFPSSGGCLNLTPANCAAAGGISGGPGTTCANYICFPTGACCLPDGSCVGPVSPSQCEAQGGVFQGNSTNCGSITCPLPTGACCFGTFCLALTQGDCGIAGGVYNGDGSTCADGNGNGTADECESVNCPGDVNDDLSVNLTDLSILLSNFGLSSGAVRGDGDLDGDGDVDLSDLSQLLANFGNQC